jgi:hypothetical protein
MTTLAGLHIPGQGTWIGADRRITSDNVKLGPVCKWVTRGEWAIGCAGDYKTLNVLQAEAALVLEATKDPQHIVHRLEKAMVKHNFSAATDGPFGPPAWGQSFLLASPDGLWDLDEQLSVFRVPDETLWATGSGRDFALGAGHAARQDSGSSPADCVRLAIEAALTFDVMSGHGGWFAHLPPAEKTSCAKTRKTRLQDK